MLRLWEEFLSVDASNAGSLTEFCRRRRFVLFDPEVLKQGGRLIYRGNPAPSEFAEWQKRIRLVADAATAYQERMQILAQRRRHGGRTEDEAFKLAVWIAATSDVFLRYLSPVVWAKSVDGVPVLDVSMGIADVTGEAEAWPGEPPAAWMLKKGHAFLATPVRSARGYTTMGHVYWDLMETLREGLPIRQCGNCKKPFVATKRQAAKDRAYCKVCQMPGPYSGISPARRKYMRDYMRKRRVEQRRQKP